MRKQMMMSVGRMNLQFEVEEDKIPEVIEEVFGDDKRQMGPNFWIRKSAITVVGEAQMQSRIQVPKQMIDPKTVIQA